jgi:hypothetical protein
MSAGQGGGADEACMLGHGPKRFRNVEHMIVDTLEAAGAAHIHFNPLTERACAKELKRIARAERVMVNDSTLISILHASQCDLFNAIQSLSLHAVGVGRAYTRSRGSSKHAAGGSASHKIKENQARDIGLNLFHALGKILYNKRFGIDGERVLPGCGLSLGLFGNIHVQGSILSTLGSRFQER